jgi:hypothetical protein
LTHFSPNKILESFEIKGWHVLKEEFDSRKMITKKNTMMKRDDSFRKTRFLREGKKEVCFNEEIQREDFWGTQEIEPRNTRPSKKKKYQNKES